jgi:predicted transcriptional regulator of viral defense system
MHYEKKLKELIKNHNGIILTRDVEYAKIPRQYLTILVQKNELERVNQGVYLASNALVDEIYCIQIRSNKVVFSNETALFIHDLTDRDPLVYTVTVPRGYSTNRLRESGIVVSTVKKEFYSIGITQKKTIYGHDINVYDIERTICDIIKNRNKMDKDMFYIALKRYSSSKSKNLKHLMVYAKRLSMEKRVMQYMEGLLV